MVKKTLISASVILSLALGMAVCQSSGKETSHIEDLFEIRTSITNQGKILPELIRKAYSNDLRTLERIFELNTSAVTTIEAYFRILKIALSSNMESDPETVEIMNGWLTFINNQCSYDIEYLDEALNETTNAEVIEQLNTARDNVKRLATISEKGILENAAGETL